MQNDDMRKEAVITVRIPIALKRKLETRARRERRSLSAQITVLLETAIDSEVPGARDSGCLLGRFDGRRIPSDAELAEVRRLWERP